ncbi:MAG: hypothetical protein K8R25_04685 [Methanosarcinales archaeon]|nr:hypothetical protein [Methanosarcinales archaeon]
MNLLDALKQMGLTEYESKAYMKLVEHGHLSAKEASELSGIPYSKVYTTLISLVDKGWVIVKEGRPKKYRPVEPSFASEIALKKQTHVLCDASKLINETLQSLFSEDTAVGKSEIWSIKGSDNVLRKFEEVLNLSNEEIFCLLLNIDNNLVHIDALLQKAKNRGCKVFAVYKKSPENKVNPHFNNFIVWESSHKIEGKGIFLFADSKVIFLGSLDERSVALWSNDLSLAEVVNNIISIDKLEKYSGFIHK